MQNLSNVFSVVTNLKLHASLQQCAAPPDNEVIPECRRHLPKKPYKGQMNTYLFIIGHHLYLPADMANSTLCEYLSKHWTTTSKRPALLNIDKA